MLDEWDDVAWLREKAEDELAEKRAELAEYSQHDLEELVQELRVHQVELELQNEALCATQAELQVVRDDYARLYDEAPVGYFSIDPDGRIARVNRTGADLLGGQPAALEGQPLHHYVARDSQDALHLFVVRLLHLSLIHISEPTRPY